MHPDLNDFARDLRSDAHHKGAHAGIAGVRRQPVGNHRPAEQQGTEDADGQRPAPQRIGGLGCRRRCRDLLRLRNPHFIHAEYPWLTHVPRSARIQPMFASFRGGVEARITSLTGLGNRKSLARR